MLLKVNMFLVVRSANFCKTFFFLLGTLVLSPKSDNVITKTTLSQRPLRRQQLTGVVQGGQGKRSKRRTNDDSVKQCIERYHPAVTHYCRVKSLVI